MDTRELLERGKTEGDELYSEGLADLIGATYADDIRVPALWVAQMISIAVILSLIHKYGVPTDLDSLWPSGS